jgi:hypothetical protein
MKEMNYSKRVRERRRSSLIFEMEQYVLLLFAEHEFRIKWFQFRGSETR